MYLLKVLVFAGLFLPHCVIADKCPSPKQINERDLAEHYEWSVAEGVSLNDLLAVKQLTAVWIMNHDEFVRCQYQGKQTEIYLDAQPKLLGCRITISNTLWVTRTEGQINCLESNHDDCRFVQTCHQQAVETQQQ